MAFTDTMYHDNMLLIFFDVWESIVRVVVTERVTEYYMRPLTVSNKQKIKFGNLKTDTIHRFLTFTYFGHP